MQQHAYGDPAGGEGQEDQRFQCSKLGNQHVDLNFSGVEQQDDHDNAEYEQSIKKFLVHGSSSPCSRFSAGMV